MAGETATLTTSPLVLSEQPFKTEKESNINHKERTFLNMLEDLFSLKFLATRRLVVKQPSPRWRFGCLKTHQFIFILQHCACRRQPAIYSWADDALVVAATMDGYMAMNIDAHDVLTH